MCHHTVHKRPAVVHYGLILEGKWHIGSCHVILHSGEAVESKYSTATRHACLHVVRRDILSVLMLRPEPWLC